MKKKILLLMVLVVFGAVSLLAYRTTVKVKKKQQAKELLASVPNIHLFDLDSSSFALIKTFRSRSMVVVYFNPACEHCQYEAETISNNLDKFGNTDIIMISDENISAIRKFAADYRLDRQSQVNFYKIDPNLVFSTFGKYTVPTILIYDENGHLAKRFDGETKVEAILNYL